MKKSVLWMGLVCAALGAACSNDAPGLETEIDVTDDMKADGQRRPLGAYEPTAETSGDATLELLLLKSDKTFFARLRPYDCEDDGACALEELSGTYRFTASREKRYVRLLDTDGALVRRYQYEFEEDDLRVRDLETNARFVLRWRENGYCIAPSDCEIQGLAQPRCLGRWECEENACGYECGSAPPPPGRPECRAVGTRSEGWYDPSTDELICWAACDGADAECDAVGTRSEGWYSTIEGAGCGGSDLIRWDSACHDDPPPTATAPTCQHVGTSMEGWYDATTGDVRCVSPCAGQVAECRAIGSRSEGWYTDGQGCIGAGGLIGWDDCG